MFFQDSRLDPDSIERVNEIAFDNRANAEASSSPSITFEGERLLELCRWEADVVLLLRPVVKVGVRGSRSFLNGASSRERTRSMEASSNSDGNSLIHFSNGLRDCERMAI